MSEPTDTTKLATHLVQTRYEDIPEHVIVLAKQKTLDMIGCFIYGRVLPAASPAFAVVLSMGGAPEATLAGESQKVPAPWAALANGTASHCFEMDDRQPESALHPGSAVVPAALAVAESDGLTGKDYLAALTLGHDVGCRIGAAIAVGGKTGGKKPGYHGMGSWASIAAAAVSARGMRLDARQAEQAMSISTATGFAMDFVSLAEGAKGYHAGKAAMGGVIAARLVKAGMVGPMNFLDFAPPGDTRSNTGYLALLSKNPDRARMLRDLGKVYELETGGTKRYAGDGCMQAGIDAMRSLTRQHNLKADEIEAINVHTMTHNLEENTYVRPQKPIEAFFSYPHVLAVALIDGDVTPAIARPEVIARPELDEIRHKVHLFADPEYDKLWPGLRPARVEVVTNRGSFEEEVLASKGTKENPMTWDEQVEKFMLLAEDALGSEQAQRVVDAVWTLDQAADVAGLTALLRP